MNDGIPVMRTFLIPMGSVRGSLRANIVQFLGVTPCSQGALICALCVEQKTPGPASTILNANGQRMAAAGPEEPLWHIFVVGDGQSPPAVPEGQQPPAYLGALGVNIPGGAVGGMFFFAQPGAVDAES